MEYKLVYFKAAISVDENRLEFEKEINNLIEQGWIPQGGFHYNSSNRGCFQAMIRHKK